MAGIVKMPGAFAVTPSQISVPSAYRSRTTRRPLKFQSHSPSPPSTNTTSTPTPTAQYTSLMQNGYNECFS
ncbi:hypothetical protein ACFX2I_023042 [Malus domestica]